MLLVGHIIGNDMVRTINALKFERLAAQEKDEDLKLSLLQQALAYRKLAENRAKKLGKSIDDGR